MTAADEVGHIRQLAQTALSSERVLQGQDTMIDQDARDSAGAAMSKITGHELLCTERWNQQREAMSRVEVALKEVGVKVDKQMGKIPAGVIAALTGLVGFLAARAFPLH